MKKIADNGCTCLALAASNLADLVEHKNRTTDRIDAALMWLGKARGYVDELIAHATPAQLHAIKKGAV